MQIGEERRGEGDEGVLTGACSCTMSEDIKMKQVANSCFWFCLFLFCFFIYFRWWYPYDWPYY